MIDKNINTVFLAVKKDYFGNNDLKSLIRAIHQKNIKVHAVFGDAEAMLPGKHDKVTDILKLVLDYNKTVNDNEKFDGFQTDVEPHELPLWRHNQEIRPELNQSFIELHRTCRSMIKAAQDRSFLFGAAITGAREKDNLYSITINSNGQEIPLPELLAKELDYLAVMAYKKNPESIMRSAAPALKTAEKCAVKCWIGIEINNLKTDPEETVDSINDSCRNEPFYAGLAIHSYRTYAKPQ